MRLKAGGPANGRCKAPRCSNEAVSLQNDYCSRSCEHKDRTQHPPAEYYEKKEWERKAPYTLGCEPDFPGDER